MRNRVVCFGEVLWDILPEAHRIGGAPLNVCYHLNKMGLEAKIVSQVGADRLGDQLKSELKKLFIDTSFCSTTDSYKTSTVEVELDVSGKPTYTIVEQVAWDYIPFEEEIASYIAEADAFVFGTLAARNTFSFETLKQYLTYSSYNVIDVNLRPPFFTKELVLALISYADTLKLNDEELHLIASWLKFSALHEVEVMKGILLYFPRLKEIILTKGEEGVLYYSNEQSVQVPSLKVEVKDTVGAGDAFLAAYLASKLKGSSIEEALQKGVKLSAYVVTQSGACPDYQ